ncbi:hypothetical protein P152DRAFT_384680, partial [Eremomyces bilateralis CBS 781.70]
PLDIRIPTTSTAHPPTTKPHTLYHLILTSPLRTTELQKRYSDFLALHAALTASTATPPPAPLPPKSWLTRTIASPSLTETRRQRLEAYLRAIEADIDPRWRNTPAWRTFLGLPAGAAAAGGGAFGEDGVKARGGLIGVLGAIASPGAWLDAHAELKTQLQQARLQLAKRDQSSTSLGSGGEGGRDVQGKREASANAKKGLVRAGTLIARLEEGLGRLEGKGELGRGEVRRRRDLLGVARMEREGLEGVLNAWSASRVGKEEESAGDKKGELMGGAGGRGRRVLGAPLKETERSRELDNQGVLQLQQRIMKEQDQDVESMTGVVRRIKEMGIAINEELVSQMDLVNILDQDVDR